MSVDELAALLADGDRQHVLAELGQLTDAERKTLGGYRSTYPCSRAGLA